MLVQVSDPLFNTRHLSCAEIFGIADQILKKEGNALGIYETSVPLTACCTALPYILYSPVMYAGYIHRHTLLGLFGSSKSGRCLASDRDRSRKSRDSKRNTAKLKAGDAEELKHSRSLMCDSYSDLRQYYERRSAYASNNLVEFLMIVDGNCIAQQCIECERLIVVLVRKHGRMVPAYYSLDCRSVIRAATYRQAIKCYLRLFIDYLVSYTRGCLR